VAFEGAPYRRRWEQAISGHDNYHCLARIVVTSREFATEVVTSGGRRPESGHLRGTLVALRLVGRPDGSGRDRSERRRSARCRIEPVWMQVRTVPGLITRTWLYKLSLLVEFSIQRTRWPSPSATRSLPHTLRSRQILFKPPAQASYRYAGSTSARQVQQRKEPEVITRRHARLIVAAGIIMASLMAAVGISSATGHGGVLGASGARPAGIWMGD
jgi:hypothetical protein